MQRNVGLFEFFRSPSGGRGARGGGAEEREDPLAVRLALTVRGAARRASAPKELHLTDSRPSFF